MNNIAAGVAARFALLDALRQREVAVFGPSISVLNTKYLEVVNSVLRVILYTSD